MNGKGRPSEIRHVLDRARFRTERGVYAASAQQHPWVVAEFPERRPVRTVKRHEGRAPTPFLAWTRNNLSRRKPSSPIVDVSFTKTSGTGRTSATSRCHRHPETQNGRWHSLLIHPVLATTPYLSSLPHDTPRPAHRIASAAHCRHAEFPSN